MQFLYSTVNALVLFIYNQIFTGYGVFAARDILKGEFVAEYVGERITVEEGERRLSNTFGRSYMYFVTHKKQKFW